MIKVQTIGVPNIRIQPRPNAYITGYGVVVNQNTMVTPPVITDKLLLEDLTSFLMMEDNTSFLLLEA